MRKIFPVLISLFVLGAGIALTLKSLHEQPSENPSPEILNIGNHQVTIVWQSEKEYAGQILYMAADSDKAPLSAIESRGKTDLHKIVITGLNPSTRYIYWVKGSENRYQFQTQPLPSSPFSFLIVFGNISDRIIPLMASEMPDFILSLTQTQENSPDNFADIRPYTPVYGPAGADSPWLKKIDASAFNSKESWKIDWGGIRLISPGSKKDIPKIKEMLETPSAQVFGLITSPDIFERVDQDEIPFESHDKTSLQNLGLHSLLVDHNRNNPTRPTAFVAVAGETNKIIEADSIIYMGIPLAPDSGRTSSTGAIRIDVDVELITATFLDENRTVVLKSPPLKQKITCEECRRLADKGSYEDSVDAYIAFIKNNQGHYQIDDAYFAIAGILDEKLFQFKKALEWYTRLIDEYPSGTLSPLAKQRIKYLSKYSDFDYKPLVLFERIRKVEFERNIEDINKRNKLLNEVTVIAETYPESSLTPVMLFWLANQYRLINVDKAIKIYSKLKHSFPEHPDAEDILIEIGETYYDAGRYKESMTAYKKALSELPYLEDMINAQIMRCERNLNRITIARTCWVLTALMIALSFLCRSQGSLKNTTFTFLVSFIILAVLVFIGAWLVREQFSSIKEMFQIVVIFPLITVTGASISKGFANRLFSRDDDATLYRRLSIVITGSLAGIIFMLAGVYLAIYYINTHYLIVAGL